MDTTGFRQDEYLVRVTGITVPAQAISPVQYRRDQPTTIPTTRITPTPYPTAATGKISVSSTPSNADIYLDGQDTGQNTPALSDGDQQRKTHGCAESRRLPGLQPDRDRYHGPDNCDTGDINQSICFNREFHRFARERDRSPDGTMFRYISREPEYVQIRFR